MENFRKDIQVFSKELLKFTFKLLHIQFIRFEKGKGIFVGKLYHQRGKLSKRLIHFGMSGLAAVGIIIGPYIAKEFPGRSVDPWNVSSTSQVLSASTDNQEYSTNLSPNREAIVDYTVQAGDTVSTIAEKFGISIDTIRWQNKLASTDSIKEGEVLQILPVTGIAHKVEKGDTVYTIAKKYSPPGASTEVNQGISQGILDFSFNTFTNDETYDLAIGQIVFVPNGVKYEVGVTFTPIAQKITPNAGTVVANGSFVWPTQGVITQNFYWYHPGIDIANNAAPNVLAADSGTIVSVGWDPSGYGNKIIIDHGNGTQTLYGHLSAFYVTVGQGVNRGNAIGRMGSTGRSTGTHLHFEIHKNGVHLNPLSYLK